MRENSETFVFLSSISIGENVSDISRNLSVVFVVVLDFLQ